jgi:hypothetical protein
MTTQATTQAHGTESELAELRAMIQTVAEAVGLLAAALEQLPTEQPEEAKRRLNRDVRRAHELLLAVARPATGSGDPADSAQ